MSKKAALVYSKFTNVSNFFPKLLGHRTVQIALRCSSSQVQESYQPIHEIKSTHKPPRVRTLKKFATPFPKCFFVGKCDPKLLEYPEVLDNEEIESLKARSTNVANVLHSEVNSDELDRKSAIPKNIQKRLSDVGLCGVRLPREFGGLGLTETDNAFLSERAGMDGSIAKFIIEQHNLCGMFLHLFGTEDQKKRYLEPLISGDITLAVAYAENFQLSDTITGMSSVALPGESGGFELTGTKEFVYNASLADAFIVFASHAKTEQDGLKSAASSAFLVPKDTPGLTVLPSTPKFGLRGVPFSQIDLNNVKIGSSNLIGKPHEGKSMMLNVMGGKFSIAPAVVGIAKSIINDVTQQCIKEDFMKARKVEKEYVKASLGRMMTAVYALESATYLQAGIADIYEDPDTFLETCMLKVLASNTYNFILREACQVLGTHACLSQEFQYLDRLMRDSHHHSVADETDLLLKITISLHGLQHTGKEVHEQVKKVRNPVMFPTFILKQMVSNSGIFRRSKEAPALGLGLEGYLHPNLQHAASVLESCISRCNQGSELLLSRYGQEIIEKHFEMNSLAEISIKAYALLATLGRASRSFCIGLKDSEAEMEIAIAYTNYCLRSVERHFADLSDGPVLNNTNRYMMIFDRMLSGKGYFAESPIERNF